MGIRASEVDSFTITNNWRYGDTRKKKKEENKGNRTIDRANNNKIDLEMLEVLQTLRYTHHVYCVTSCRISLVSWNCELHNLNIW